MANINVQGFLDSLSSRQQGSAEEDLLAQRRQSISEDIYSTASKSRQPFKTSLATAMGDTLGKGLLRAFNVKDTERQRAIDTDQANKLLAELQKKPMTSKNLMEMASLYQSQNEQESAIKAITLAREIDAQTAQQETTATQKVNVANQALAAGYQDLADRVADQTLSPQEGLAEIFKRQKEEADKKAADAAASAAAGKPNNEIREQDDGTFVIIDKDTGKQTNVTLTREQQEIVDKAALNNKKMAVARADNVLSQLDRIEALAISPPDAATGWDGAAGGAYVINQFIPATDAYTLSNIIQSVKANLSFDELQRMRDASPTGGALGQVSNIEIGLLQNAVAALNPAVGEEEFKEQLNIVRKHYSNVRNIILGKSVKLDFTRPEYKKYVIEYKGEKYFRDPVDKKDYKLDKEDYALD